MCSALTKIITVRQSSELKNIVLIKVEVDRRFTHWLHSVIVHLTSIFHVALRRRAWNRWRRSEYSRQLADHLLFLRPHLVKVRELLVTQQSLFIGELPAAQEANQLGPIGYFVAVVYFAIRPAVPGFAVLVVSHDGSTLQQGGEKKDTSWCLCG